MTSLITVAGIALPEPSTYNAYTSTVVDGGRNMLGEYIGAVVRDDMAKVDVGWSFLTAKQWSDILKLFTISQSGKFINSVMFFNQTIGAFDTRQMYVSDRTSGLWRRDHNTGEVIGFTDCKLSLIEV